MAKVQTIGDLSERYLRANPILRHLSGIPGVAFFGYSPRHRCLLWWTANLAPLLGANQQQLMRNSNLFLRYTHEDDRFRILSELEKAFSGTQEYRVSYRWITPIKNQCLWLHCRGALRQKSNYPVFEGFILDMQAEHADGTLGDEAIFNNLAILDSLPCSSILLNADFRIEHSAIQSDALRFFTDESQSTTNELTDGKLFEDCIRHQELREIVKKALPLIAEQQTFQREVVGSFQIDFTPVALQQSPEAYLIQISDISQQVAIQQQLDELCKADTSRSITSSVLHNVSNTLQTMVGELQTLNNNSNDIALSKRLSESILQRVVRLSNLTSQARSLENDSSPVAQEADINLCLLIAIQQAQRTSTSYFPIAFHFGDTPPVTIRQSQLVNAFGSILEVARNTESITRLSITTKSFEELATVEFLVQCAAERASTTQDSGFLNDTELDDSLSFIRDSGGAVEEQQRSPSELCISISLPGYNPEQSKPAPPQEVVAPEVLIVDDDPLVLECLGAMCADLGYSCITAQNGLDALRLIHAHDETLRVALVDGLLPGMSGATIVKKLKAINPELIVIGISGAAADVCAEMERAGAMQVLSKPVSLKMLKDELADFKPSLAVG